MIWADIRKHRNYPRTQKKEAVQNNNKVISLLTPSSLNCHTRSDTHVTYMTSFSPSPTSWQTRSTISTPTLNLFFTSPAYLSQPALNHPSSHHVLSCRYRRSLVYPRPSDPCLPHFASRGQDGHREGQGDRRGGGHCLNLSARPPISRICIHLRIGEQKGRRNLGLRHREGSADDQRNQGDPRYATTLSLTRFRVLMIHDGVVQA